jgi:hypothetical protein
VPPTMVIVAPKVLRIPLPKFHDGDDAIIHIGRLTKVYVTNGEDTDAHKLQLFLQHYEEKMRVCLFIMRQQIMLQRKERFNMPLFQDSVMCTVKDKP